MDWKSFKEQASVWSEKASVIAKKGFETSKEYAEKTGAWSYEKLKESKFTLKDLASYEKLGEEKRYAIFCIRDGDIFTKFFLTILPVLFTKAWIESGSIRIIIEEGSEDLRKALEIDTIPSVIMKMSDGTIQKIDTEEEIRTLIKNFSFYGTDTEKTENIP
ncbi:MAG: hypothetical protein PHH16_03930 [Candidatus Gracilibacteria bacterium]|nr:hypothetical protein [Candidatus Gracilibacteria bacterium]